MNEQTDSQKQKFNPDLYTYDPNEQPRWMIFQNIAIQTVTFNKLEHTQTFIESLYSKTHLPFTLYIFDQASSDGTAEYLEQLRQTKSNVIVERFGKNIGLGRSYLHARKTVKGNLLVHFDNDIEIVSNYWLVHLIKAYYAYWLSAGNTRLALGLRMVNQEEYGFRFAHTLTTYQIPPEHNALPRTSYSKNSGFRAEQKGAPLPDEHVCIGYTDHLCGGAWAIPLEQFQQMRWEDYYPVAIGGVDTFSSNECQRMNIHLGYIENGPVVRHNDWPYTDEKIELYSHLLEERVVADRHYLTWKLKRLFNRLR